MKFSRDGFLIRNGWESEEEPDQKQSWEPDAYPEHVHTFGHYEGDTWEYCSVCGERGELAVRETK